MNTTKPDLNPTGTRVNSNTREQTRLRLGHRGIIEPTQMPVRGPRDH